MLCWREIESAYNESPGSNMRKLKKSLILAAAAALLVCADNASAQLPSPGYIFLEATDQADKPVVSAAAVVYDESGKEVGSSATDREGKATLLQNSREKKKFIFRVIKSGYLTYEGVFETSGEYKHVEIKVKLISATNPGTKTEKGRQSVSAHTVNLPMLEPGGPSPPSNQTGIRDANLRASSSIVLQAHPT
jgi:hypothetical protein